MQAQQQQEQQQAARDRAAEDGARLLVLHRDSERLHGEASSLWQSVSTAVLAAGPHTMDPPGERSNKFDFVKQGLRMRRCSQVSCHHPKQMRDQQHTLCMHRSASNVEYALAQHCTYIVL